MAFSLRAALVGGLAAIVAGAACGDSPKAPPSTVAPPPGAEAAATPPRFAPPERPLGVAALAELAWSARAGQPAFRRARVAERRGQWQDMVAHCQTALAADATHLEASWVLAAGYARLGRFAEVGAPLWRAVVGDPAKWGPPALSLQLFAPYWQSGHGAALRPWIEQALRELAAALARSVVLLSQDRLVAYDRQTRRYFSLARPHRARGAVVAGPAVVFASRARVDGELVDRLGVIDLRTAEVTMTALPPGRRRELALWIDGAEVSPLARIGGGPWQRASAGVLAPASAEVPRELSPRLVWKDARVFVERHPVADVMADWDQARMASALRLRRSNRVVAAPAPTMIDGHRVVWAPDRQRLAFVAGADTCERTAAGPTPFLAFVVDAVTGARQEVARSDDGLELAWADAHVLAVGSAHTVTLHDLSAEPAAPVVLEGVALPRAVPRVRCSDPDAEASAEDPDEL